MVWKLNVFYFRLPHPNLLPQGEREFPDENQLKKGLKEEALAKS
jgi:hypothetical protein